MLCLFIEERLKTLGYAEDNQAMVHDYLHYMLIDILVANKYIFITENDIRKSPVIKKVLNDTTPDFVIQRNEKIKKTLVIDIYVGNKEISEIKSKYRKLDFFADLKIITPNNFASELSYLFEQSEILLVCLYEIKKDVI